MRQSNPQRRRPEPRALSETERRELERKIFVAINNHRLRKRLKPLIWDDKVQEAAREHSQRMAEARFFAHEDPQRGNVGARLKRRRIAWTMCGENIATQKGYTDRVGVAVTGWMESPGHRENIMTEEFTHTGVGIFRRADGTYYYTQIFTRY